MDGEPEKKSRRAILLGAGLTPDERRSQQRMIRLSVYVDVAVFVGCGIAFKADWLVVFLIWFLVNIGLLGWLVVAIRRAAASTTFQPTDEEKSEARFSLTRKLALASYLIIVSGALLLLSATTTTQRVNVRMLTGVTVLILGLVTLAVAIVCPPRHQRVVRFFATCLDPSRTGLLLASPGW